MLHHVEIDSWAARSEREFDLWHEPSAQYKEGHLPGLWLSVYFFAVLTAPCQKLKYATAKMGTKVDGDGDGGNCRNNDRPVISLDCLAQARTELSCGKKGMMTQCVFQGRQ